MTHWWQVLPNSLHSNNLAAIDFMVVIRYNDRVRFGSYTHLKMEEMMLVKYIRDYRKNGQVVATLVATGPGQVGVAFLNPIDKLNKSQGINLAKKRAESEDVVVIPNKRIAANKLMPEVRFALVEVLQVELDKMADRSLRYFRD